MKGKANAKYTYLFELPPGNDRFGSIGFILDERNIEPVGRETFEAVKVIAQAVAGKQLIST